MSNYSSVPLSEVKEALFGGVAPKLMDKWGAYIEVVREAKQNQGMAFDELSEVNLAKVLETTQKWINNMDEATRTANVGSFINHGFELITAVMPNLISNEIFTTQAMTRRVGEIFYMNFLFGTHKANVQAGDMMFGTVAAGNLDYSYTAEDIEGEKIATGTGGVGPYTGTLTVHPWKFTPASLKLTWITGGVEKSVIDNGTDLHTANAEIDASSWSTTTGAISITFAAGSEPDNLTDILLDYSCSYEEHPELIPEVNIQLVSTPVTAKTRNLRTSYSLLAQFDVEAAHGRSMDADLKSVTAMEVRQEIDTYNIMLAYKAAKVAAATSRMPKTTWAYAPDAGISYFEHKWTFIDQGVIPACDAIYDVTRRARGNILVVGNKVAHVIQGLAPRFKASGEVVAGPHFMGTLDEKRVYRCPALPTNVALCVFKGNIFLQASLVFATYMPIFTTSTVVLDDVHGRFGLATSNAHLIVNDLFFSLLEVDFTP